MIPSSRPKEFSKLVQSPKLKFWMGQLELEYHDLLSLFECLDFLKVQFGPWCEEAFKRDGIFEASWN